MFADLRYRNNCDGSFTHVRRTTCVQSYANNKDETELAIGHMSEASVACVSNQRLVCTWLEAGTHVLRYAISLLSSSGAGNLLVQGRYASRNSGFITVHAAKRHQLSSG